MGDKTPIAAISEEYAKGDPIYVAKTLVSFSSHFPFAVLLSLAVAVQQVKQC